MGSSLRANNLHHVHRGKAKMGKWEIAKAIWHTDGSAKKTEEDGTIIGFGAYH